MSVSPSQDEKLAERRVTDDASDAGPLEWTREEERKLVSKLDWRVTSLVTVLFTAAFLDRSNAQTAGMGKDLGLSSSEFQWLLTIFYIGYIIGQPATLLWKVFPPRIWVACLTLSWGGFALREFHYLISSFPPAQPSSAATDLRFAVAVLRLFMGLAETAFAPGVTYYLTFFYSRREVGLRQAIYLGAAPLATAYAGALAYGITHIKNGAIADWRILFLIEGFPALILAPVVYFCLPDSASTAKFLTERERAITVARAAKDGRVGHDDKLDWKKVGSGLADPKAWIQALMYFSTNVSYSSLPVFLPTILTEMGFTSIRAQGLTAPPYLASLFVLLACAFLSDRWGDRSAFLIPLATLGGIGYVILATCTQTAVRYFAVYLCACGIFPVVALTLPWVRPYYVKGMSVCAGFIFLVAILASILRYILILENRKLDAAEAAVAAEGTVSEEDEKSEAIPFRPAGAEPGSSHPLLPFLLNLDISTSSRLATRRIPAGEPSPLYPTMLPAVPTRLDRLSALPLELLDSIASHLECTGRRGHDPHALSALASTSRAFGARFRLRGVRLQLSDAVVEGGTGHRVGRQRPVYYLEDARQGDFGWTPFFFYPENITESEEPFQLIPLIAGGIEDGKDGGRRLRLLCHSPRFEPHAHGVIWTEHEVYLDEEMTEAMVYRYDSHDLPDDRAVDWDRDLAGQVRVVTTALMQERFGCEECSGTRQVEVTESSMAIYEQVSCSHWAWSCEEPFRSSCPRCTIDIPALRRLAEEVVDLETEMVEKLEEAKRWLESGMQDDLAVKIEQAAKRALARTRGGKWACG
ncbi:hypothetical protein RQP46_002157 [Phenoliferia psychrophenolica]